MSTIAAPPPLTRSAVIPIGDAAAIGACEVCRHPLTDHDPIARRYCDATMANALTRGCICAAHAH